MTPVAPAWPARPASEGRSVFDVKDAAYGAKGDGSTNDTAAVTAAVVAAAAAGTVATVFFPRGTYLVGSLTVPSNVALRGAGAQSIIKRPAGDTGHWFLLDGVSRVSVTDLAFDGNVANVPSGGWAFRVINGASDILFANLRIADQIQAGIGITYGGGGIAPKRVKVANVTALNCAWGVHVGGATLPTDIELVNVTIDGATATGAGEGGLYIAAGQRIRVANTAAVNCAGHGLFVAGQDVSFVGCQFNLNGGLSTTADLRGATVATGARRVTFSACEFNSNAEDGVITNAGADEIAFIGCTASGNNTGARPGGHGFELLAKSRLVGCQAHDNGNAGGAAANASCGVYVGATGSLVSACDARGNWSSGIRVYDSNHTRVIGCRAWNNGQRSAGAHHGIEFHGTAVNSTLNVSAIGNRCYDDQGAKTQAYGISVSNNVDRFTVALNDCDGNLTGNVTLPTTSYRGTVLSNDATNPLTAGLAPSLPGLVAPVIQPSAIPQGNGVFTANTVYTLRAVVPKSGILKELSWFVSSGTGNVIAMLFDTGDAASTVRTKLWDSGSIAAGGAGAFQSVDPSAVGAAPLTAPLKAGQQVELAIMTDSATLNLGRLTVAAGAFATLPSNSYLPSPGGVRPKLMGSFAPGSFAAPASITEAQLAGSAANPLLVGRIA